MPAERDFPTTAYLVWRLSTKLRAAADRALAPLGLTHAQYALLASLYGLARDGTRPSQRELADFSGLEPMYVSKLARSLEGDELVVRAPNPADPRAVALALTERGAAVASQAIDVVLALQDELTAPIGGRRGARNAELIATLQALLNGHEPAHRDPTTGAGESRGPCSSAPIESARPTPAVSRGPRS
jgi:DNA-binding MarR family transcriptional regulator